MNWYKGLKTSSLEKHADPHIEETCLNCGHEFVLDLMWERMDDSSKYRAIDDTGHIYDSLTVPQIAEEKHRIVDEWSKEKVTCPQCHSSWYSKFERKPQQSNYPTERILSRDLNQNRQYHVPARTV